MNKVGVLCAMNRLMLLEFSHRTAEGLEEHTLFKLLLPPFRSFLEINVGKEIEKDRLVITSAAAAQGTGIAPNAADIQQLLHQAREIDRTFLRQASPFPITINIPYEEIESFRRRRIERLLDAAYRLFGQWDGTPRFRTAIAGLYDQEQFRALLREILCLYGRETKMLSRSVRIPRALIVARDSLTQTLYSVMERVAEELAQELADKAYRRK